MTHRRPGRTRLARMALSGLALTTAAAVAVPLTSTASAVSAPGQTDAAVTKAGTAYQSSAAPLTAEQLKNPDAEHRPATRWWWSGPISVEESVRELNAIADAGFGEVEIAFSTDVWANDTQRENLRAVMAAAKQRGVVVSMTTGAGWPLQTPNTTTGTGLSQQELQYGRADVAAGATFSGKAPAAIDAARPGKAGGKLVAVTVGKVLEAGPPATIYATGEKPRYIKSDIKPPATSTVLDPASLKDVTASVQPDGTLSWTAPAGSGDWILFSFWQRDAGPYASAFDRNAAKAAAEYLSANQIGDANKGLLAEVGGSLFEDSLELNADSLFWAPLFPELFQSKNGYDMVSHLPLMFAHGMSRYWLPNEEPTPDFELPAKEGAKVRADYYRLLTDAYVDDHLKPLQEWAEGLGVKHKTQAAYGQNLEPIRSFRELARAGGEVEGESYNSGDRFPIDIDHMSWRFSLDWQRIVTSGAHQAGETSISSELGAQQATTHSINLSDYQEMVDKEWAAGLTKPFLHGYQYMSIGAPWPGKYRFGDTGIDSFNDVNNPQWPMFKQQNAYWARGTQVLETGTPRTDVAIYRDGFLTTAARNQQRDEGTQPSRLFNGLALEKSGYSLGFIDPVGLAEKDVVGQGALFPAGPAYRAIVVDERSVPLKAAQALAQAAASGVRVVFVGDLPAKDKTYGSGAAGDQGVKDAVAKTLASGNAVRVAEQQDVSAALEKAGVTPRVDWAGKHVLTQVRDTDGVRYVYLYNPTNSKVEFEPSFEGNGRPSTIDLWDGSVDPIARYDSSSNRVDVPLTLAAKTATVIAIDERAAQPVHVVSGPEGDVSYDGDTIVYEAEESGTYTFTLSDGTSRTVTPKVPVKAWASVAPRLWNLTVDAFTPTGTKTINVGARENPRALWDWRDIPGIQGESGVGTYTGVIDLPADWKQGDSRVKLNLGKVAGTAEIQLNGQPVGSQTVDGRTWDVTELAKPGNNDLKVVVRTTMRNAVTTYNKVFTRTQEYGLLGEVDVNPATRTTVYDPAAAAKPSVVRAVSTRGTYGTATEVPVTVTSDGAVATGSVGLFQGSRQIASAVLADQKATLVVPGTALKAGFHRLTVRYAGTSAAAAAETAISISVAKARSTVSAGTTSPRATTRPKISVRVTASGVVPSGWVDVRRGGKRIARAKLNGSGRATVVLPKQRAGTRKFSVVYRGDANVAKAPAKSVTVRVRR